MNDLDRDTQDTTADSMPWSHRLRKRVRLLSTDLTIGGLILLVTVLFMLPSMVITIPAGHLGVLWKRFDGGTDVRQVLGEGTVLILPWNRVEIYDARLQSEDREFEVLSSDGLKLGVSIAWRFRINPVTLALLHRYAGPQYSETLVAQSVGARARDVLAVYRPEEIYTANRLAIQDQISESVRYDLINLFDPPDMQKVEWLRLEDVLIKRIDLPEGLQASIVAKNVARHEVERHLLLVDREHHESERKRVEAAGIRNFQEVVSGGMNESYLRWRGIEATLDLARSQNSKVVIVGNNKTGGLPIISFSGEDNVKSAPSADAVQGAAKPPAPSNRPSAGGR